MLLMFCIVNKTTQIEMAATRSNTGIFGGTFYGVDECQNLENKVSFS